MDRNSSQKEAWNTVEPSNKRHFGNGSFVLCSEVVPFSRNSSQKEAWNRTLQAEYTKWLDNLNSIAPNSESGGSYTGLTSWNQPQKNMLPDQPPGEGEEPLLS